MKLTIIAAIFLTSISTCLSQNYVLQFDGTNDYVNLGTNAGDGIRSIELWFKLDNEVLPTNSKRRTLLTRNSDNQIGEFGIYIGYAFLGERGRVTFTRQVGSTFYYIYSDQNSWQADRWYHVAAVIDPQDGMKMYIDGIQQQDTHPSAQPTALENEITTIGCWGDKYIRWFNGEIDELRFWERALSSSEVINNMCDSINPQNANGLVGYWKMNEEYGDTLIDHSLAGYNGYINGATYIEESIDFSYEINGYEAQFYASSNSNSFSWDFGDGSFSSEENPIHVYDSSGTYNVCLTADGMCDPLLICKEITICIDPASNFMAEINDFEVSFNQLSQEALTYFWNFGDGDTSTYMNPIHVYDSMGTYTVCLSVTNDCGQDTDCQDVSICVDPTADFYYYINGLELSFFQQSTLTEDYQWDFGDGTHSYEPNPVHTYDGEDNYIVSLIVFNDCGADQHFDTIYLLLPMMCNFNFTVDENGVVQFQDESLDAMSCFWDFGDGSTSTEQNPVHQYEANGTYNCCLTIENDEGTYSYCAEVVVETYEEPVDLNIYFSSESKSIKFDIPEDGQYKIRMFDLKGNPVYTNELFLQGGSTFELGTSTLPMGVYVVELSSVNIFERKKIMVSQL